MDLSPVIKRIKNSTMTGISGFAAIEVWNEIGVPVLHRINDLQLSGGLIPRFKTGRTGIDFFEKDEL
jgi:hypothetical protein